MRIQFFTLLTIFAIFQLSAQVVPAKPNFIFIVVDDLNDYTQGLNGNPEVQTPNINELESMGISFVNAYVNTPGCAPSRTSFLSGKDIAYTKVFNNEDYVAKFRSNFTAAEGNAEVFSLPEILKDSGGYYTYALEKIFHNSAQNDYDKSTPNPCDKDLSWNKMKHFDETLPLMDLLDNYAFGDFFDWGMIPDSLEPILQDYIMTDSAIQFINQFANGTANTCGRPFFLALGYNRPHSDRYIPQKYFPPYYLEDIYEEPFVAPYNSPANAFPLNGHVMPPQPDPIYNDYYQLPELGVGQKLADFGEGYLELIEFVDQLPFLPVIDAGLTVEERQNIIMQTAASNEDLVYVAAVQYIDALIGKVIDTLQAFPELMENTIIVLVSDNGYSLGEKRHWTKWGLWETDLRVPFIIVDPSRPSNQICNRNVSLLDIFPTICDLADVAYPTFADGSDYLDGHSIIPLLNAPNSLIENPSLSTTKRTSGIGSCFPHYSVRNEKYHYIRYQKNNNGDLGITTCDLGGTYYEEELYEIGVDRETDPNEWNNLAADPDYAPVIDYLEEFMPGGSLYLQKAFTVQISTKPLPCFLNNSTTVKISSFLYSDMGSAIGGAALSNYQFKWTNNLTAATFFGRNYNFNTASIPAPVFTANNKIIFYLEVTDLTSGDLVAFKTHEISINSANTPSSTFAVVTDPVLNSADIVSYNIVGSYTNTYWTFGDGITSEEFIPDTHFYAAPGPYSIRNYIEYGNGCVKSKAKNITITREGIAEISFNIYPNPADDLLKIILDEPSREVTIQLIDILGKVVFEQKYYSSQESIQINTGQLIPGIYVVTINAGEITGNKLLEIVR